MQLAITLNHLRRRLLFLKTTYHVLESLILVAQPLQLCPDLRHLFSHFFHFFLVAGLPSSFALCAL